jgi:hypothetical protein
MDLFRYNSITPDISIGFNEGELINGATSVMWVERYLEASSFEITAPLSSGMLDMLPLGTSISRVDATEVMVVEDHQISDNSEGESSITITGRSYETNLESRQLGANAVWPKTHQSPIINVAADTTWAQAEWLINEHSLLNSTIDPNDVIPLVLTTTSVVDTGIVGPNEARLIKIGELYKSVLSLLKLNSLGFKTIRPSKLGPLYPNYKRTVALQIHNGIDRRDEVVFAYDAGDIESADYLWSTRNLKTSVLVSGVWTAVMVHGPEVETDRRVMYLDASDIDRAHNTSPGNTDYTLMAAQMVVRGNEALSAQNSVAIAKVELNTANSQFKYRDHYDIGDIVTIEGNYNATTVMRVTEYVEIEDDTGFTEYPTLSIV